MPATVFEDGTRADDLYGLLQCLPTATAAELKAAHIKQIKQWHPDTSRHIEALARAKAINAAYALLRDPIQRGDYDEGRKAAEAAARARTAQQERARRASAASRRVPTPPNRADDPSRTGLAAYLKSLGLTVIDKRSKGGALWVVGGTELRDQMQKLQRSGVRFWFQPRGGKATKHQAAWWTKYSSA